MSVTLETSLASIISNKRRVSALKSLGIVSIKDALTYYPFRVTEPMRIMRLRDILYGDSAVFVACVNSVSVIPMNVRRGFRLEVNVVDDILCSATLVYFSKKKQYVDWMLNKFKSGSKIVISGTASEFNNRLQFTHPDVLQVNDSSNLGDTHNVDNSNCITGANHDLLQGAEQKNSVEDCLKKLSSPMPIYHANSRISSEHIHDTIIASLNALEEDISDIIPESVRASHNLLHRSEAFEKIHNPQSTDDFKKALATLRYEEALVSQVAILSARNSDSSCIAQSCKCDDIRKTFVDSLPFELTQGQNEVIGEILEDMACNKPMRRLLQGEVGSGKTVVAVSAMLQAVGSGKQAVLVAPTHVLALQHADNLRNMISRANLSVKLVVVTGGMKLSERRKALASVASGEPAIIVATHAAFSSSFNPTNLALVVIDEQHRFGVEQRNSLMRSFGGNSTVPHLLVMTATPIPRSAAMTWFGDLDVSYLMQLPASRKPVRTFIVQEHDSRTMAAMFSHIRKRIDAGERAYIVCPHIEDEELDLDANARGAKNSHNIADDNDAFDDVIISNESFVEGYSGDYYESSAEGSVSEESTNGGSAIAGSIGVTVSEENNQPRKLHTVTNILQRLSALPQFNNISLVQLTGRNTDDEKKEIMRQFISGESPILVSTTVIEVGVDVPTASCMVIFDADRFGLAQLHQLRGRIGRANLQSWAFLVSCAQEGSVAEKRLQVVEKSRDGAVIAQEDLKLRNVGDVLGDKQSGGKSSLKLLRVVQDASIIASAREEAYKLISDESDFNKMTSLRGAVLDFTRGGSIISN